VEPYCEPKKFAASPKENFIKQLINQLDQQIADTIERGKSTTKTQ